MSPSSQCPCCGHVINDSAGFKWNAAARTLSGRGHAITLSPNRTKIFDAMWRAWPSGRLIQKEQMMDIMYADDPDGGPESDNSLSVQISHINKAITPFGLSIRGRNGYGIIMGSAKVAA